MKINDSIVLLAASFLGVLSTTSAFVITRPPGSSPAFITARQNTPSDPASQLQSIAPDAGTCPQPRGECITAADIVQPIIRGFAKYKIDTAPEQAALLSLMAYESGQFKFNVHHFPTVDLTQGTRNMMMSSFVLEYAKDLGLKTDDVDPAAVLATINENEDMSSGSAAWFYSVKCSDEIKNGVKTNGLAGYKAYLSDCVGVGSVDDTAIKDRVAYWDRACKALHIS